MHRVRHASGDGVIDVLRWPIVGPFLRWRHARTALQFVLCAAAALVVADGLLAPSIDPTTFATVAVWTHYRGLLIVSLLAAGNVFCSGCPFVLVRDAGRKLRMPTLTLPRRLRTKWFGIALFALVLYAYQRFGLWAEPRATAWLVLTYFAAAFAVDLTFRGASFCKYFCPIGQFNFITSMMSPLELRVRDTATCHGCRTVDCIKGNDLQRGCELRLFLPAKVGNLDCTLCLDCVHACPHDNIALAGRLPGAELADARRRSGIGRLARRPDVAALVLVFVFGALMNAFGMVTAASGLQFLLVVVAAPLVLLGIASGGRLPAAINYSYALVPFGVGMWAAHYGFHLLTGALAIVPVTQRAAVNLLGVAALGQPLWRLTGMRPGSVFPIQVGLIMLGTLGSFATAFEISTRDHPDTSVRAFVPWALLIALLAAAALWILSQPMQMTIGSLG